ncbi:MAG: SHOCT domain-containing protein [Sporichthyaceae bacterium]
MDNVRIDADGDLRCPKCGSRNLVFRRTGRAKAAGIGAGLLTVGFGGAAAGLAARKHAYCQGCKTYSLTGSPQRQVSTPAASRPGARPDELHRMYAEQRSTRFPHTFAAAVDPSQFDGAVVAGEELVRLADRLYVRYGMSSRDRGAPKTVAVPLAAIKRVLWLDRLCMVRLVLSSDETVNLSFPMNESAPAKRFLSDLSATPQITVDVPVPAQRVKPAAQRSGPEEALQPDTDVLATLTRLNELRLAGALTDEEFTQKKAELLDRL